MLSRGPATACRPCSISPTALVDPGSGRDPARVLGARRRADGRHRSRDLLLGAGDDALSSCSSSTCRGTRRDHGRGRTGLPARRVPPRRGACSRPRSPRRFESRIRTPTPRSASSSRGAGGDAPHAAARGPRRDDRPHGDHRRRGPRVRRLRRGFLPGPLRRRRRRRSGTRSSTRRSRSWQRATV